MKPHQIIPAKLLAVMLSLLAMLPCAFSVHAETLAGDLNGDGFVDCQDAGLLRDYLTGTADAEFAWESGDMDGNGALTAVDLTLLKQRILTDNLIAPTVDQVFHCLPSTGTRRIPIFAVQFSDAPHIKADNSADEDPAATLAGYAFGKADPDSPHYPMESITAYYDRASYDRLHLTGDAYNYTAKHPYAHYLERPITLLDEIITAFDKQIDFRSYDSDGDNMLDGIIIAMPLSTGLQPYTIRYNGLHRPDGVTIGKYCIGARETFSPSAFNSTWVHELGHAMGLPDYYKYEVAESESMYGMDGNAGWETMDDAAGDYSAFSKLMLGWLKESEVHIYRGGTQSFTLTSIQQKPSCIIIPRSDLNGFTGEFFVIEYNTPDVNYSAGYLHGERFTIFRRGGIRILHCLSDIAERHGYAEFKWNNYGEEYDTSNQRQRVLRLVNTVKDGYLREYAAVNGTEYSGFHWYDGDGFETVETGITVQIGSLTGGPDYVENPFSSIIPENDPAFLNGSTYSITISDET